MIDIIIPIYEGLEQTIECIDSVMRFKNSNDHRIIIINDCSPNKDINIFLEKIEQENILILTNETNQGFIKTVNRGMSISEKNDVILLNSDTIVTKRWVEKMREASYSSTEIGTVTALTNNGTIASVPIFNKDNQLPEGYTIDSFSDLIEKISNKVYPTIPTCVGHAVYIKREVINKVGLFDFETFGKGYGEENDFSARVILAGYKNILADNTYIYHYGSTSFRKDKLTYVKNNRKKLYKKFWWYRLYFKKYMIFNSQIKKICKSIQNAM